MPKELIPILPLRWEFFICTHRFRKIHRGLLKYSHFVALLNISVVHYLLLNALRE